MDLNKLNSLTIIKTNKDDTAQSRQTNISQIQPTQPTQSTQSTQTSETLQNNVMVNISDEILKIYSDVRTGKLSENDSNRKILKLNDSLNLDIDPEYKDKIRRTLMETLKWYIQLKLLISTSLKVDDLNAFIKELSFKHKKFKRFQKLKEDSIVDIFKGFNSIWTKGNLYADVSHVNHSKGILEFLKLFNGDDLLNPVFKIDTEMVVYLSNQRPTFLKEITVLFDLYSKVYDQISKDILDSNILEVRTRTELQPRFDMINRHILSSNLSTKIDYDIDLDKLGITDNTSDTNYKEYLNTISSSQLGLEKRLNFLNEWLTNGIVMIQSSLNRLNGLKPITQNGKSQIMNNVAAQPANTKYQIWTILQDCKAFLESLKGLTDGTAYITGVASNELLDVLDVNY